MNLVNSSGQNKGGRNLKDVKTYNFDLSEMKCFTSEMPNHFILTFIKWNTDFLIQNGFFFFQKLTYIAQIVWNRAKIFPEHFELNENCSFAERLKWIPLLLQLLSLFVFFHHWCRYCFVMCFHTQDLLIPLFCTKPKKSVPCYIIIWFDIFLEMFFS